MALVVAGAPVVELVGTVAVVAALVRVAMVSPLHQPGLDLFPMASVLPQVSRVVYRLLRGLYHPVLGCGVGPGVLPGVGSCSPISGAPSG